MTQHKLQKLLAELKADLQKLYRDKLVAVILYGSYARGKAGSRSDVDMVMILKNYDRDFLEIDRTSEIVARLSLAYDTTVALIPLREQDWREKQSPFLYTVRREGVEIQ